MQALLPGTHVGPWRIVDLRDRGGHGTVYLAEGEVGLVALKVAVRPRDERFTREAELLSRVQSPYVPRLIDEGRWQGHPFLVMEWVEGVPLYEWARVRRPSSRQVLRVLASLARALEAVHAVEGVHRDVKGDNVLVRMKDDRAFLTDFGSCSYRGATPLTLPGFPPDTPAYRSPEAVRFGREEGEAPTQAYVAGPANDIYALGVTAYRLATWEYPEGTEFVPARELNPRCGPELSGLISRMLSEHPESRGSASELAEALEQAAREAGPESDEALFVRKAPQPDEDEVEVIQEQRGRAGARAILAAVLALGVWLLSKPIREYAVEPRDAGVVAVGDTALTAPEASAHESSGSPPITADVPAKPFPGQVRPDANGRCPRRYMVPINGGCWIKVDPKDCEETSFMHKGQCYEPAGSPPRPATSDPADGG